MNRYAKHLITLLIVTLITPLLLSCEKEIELEHEQNKGISVYAIAIQGTPLSVRVATSFSVNTNPEIGIYQSGSYYRALDTVYHSQVAIQNADVSISVNGTDHYQLEYTDTSPYAYTSDYVPAVGDRIDLTVKAEGYTTVTSSATIEQPASIEVLSTSVLYDKDMIENDYDELTGESYNTDSVMDLVLRINDSGTGRKYYKLIVRSLASIDMSPAGPGTGAIKFYSACDIFSSNDVIFTDSQLYKAYSNWAPYFSNVFGNTLLTDGQYTLTVRSRKRRGYDQRVWVALQTISQDLYYFLKSYQIYRISTDDAYTTPIGLHSNIANGYGILGGISQDSLSVYY